MAIPEYKNDSPREVASLAPSDLQPHYSNGVFSNVYVSAGQHQEVNIAGTPFPLGTQTFSALDFEANLNLIQSAIMNTFSLGRLSLVFPVTKSLAWDPPALF